MDNENENKNPVPEVSWEEDQEDQKKEPQKYTFWQWLFMSKKKGKKAGLSKKTLILLDIKEWVFSLLFAFVAVYLIITFGVRVITVEGESMNPTLADGERLFVTAYDVRFGSAPERGDVGPISKSLIIGHVRSVVLPLKQRRGVENDAEYTYPGDLTHE